MQVDIKFSNKQSKDYKVFINELDCIDVNSKVAIITNTTVGKLHLDTLKQKIKCKSLHVITIPDGEKYKNLQTVQEILNQLFELKFNRSSTLIAFGGGVVGDITGFCASIYQRGIDFIQVPTTLLAQVDASVGGKTGVNNTYGKNLIGSFYQPKAVYCESLFLKTLPTREFNSGVSEIIKMAVVLDKDFVQFLDSNLLNTDENIAKAVERSIKLKTNVVMQDENEKGVRAVLNYGHTFAHVIENQTNYEKYLHGECVSIGINMANELAKKLAFMNENECEVIANIIKKYNLPLEYKIKDVNEFYEAFFLDKKSLDENIMFVLPKNLGSFSFEKNIPKHVVLDALRKFC